MIEKIMTKIEDLKERYEALFGEEPCDSGTLKDIEDALDISLPADFVKISTFYSGGLLGGISHLAFASEGPADNIVRETLRLRESTGLNNRYIVIAEPAESLIVLNVESAEVIWCDSVDVRNINSGNYMVEPDRWENYLAFFKYLLDEEDDE